MPRDRVGGPKGGLLTHVPPQREGHTLRSCGQAPSRASRQRAPSAKILKSAMMMISPVTWMRTCTAGSEKAELTRSNMAGGLSQNG